MYPCSGITNKGNSCKNSGTMQGTYKFFCRLHLHQDYRKYATCARDDCILWIECKGYCNLHNNRDFEFKAQFEIFRNLHNNNKDYGIFRIESPNRIQIGFFDRIEEAENCSKALQLRYDINFQNRYIIPIKRLEWYEDCYYHALTKNMSALKIDVLINLINEFIGVKYIWITKDEYVRYSYPVPFDYIPRRGEHKYMIKLNTLVDVSELPQQMF